MEKINVLFLGYWNLDDPLTSATIFPHLSILIENAKVNSVIFANTQREEQSSEHEEYLREKGITYYPLISKNYGMTIITKTADFISFPKEVLKICKHNSVNLIIARGAPAGALAWLVARKFDTPFIVESYEPHAEYMLDSEVWNKLDPRYIMQSYWEGKIKRYAKFLVVVSHNYREKLITEGISASKLKLAPCAVDFNKFFFDEKHRFSIRSELEIEMTSVVMVYAGKFGGMYHNKKLFRLIRSFFDYFGPNFYAIILSNLDDEIFYEECKLENIPLDKIKKKYVKHHEVVKYLSAADFAIAPYKKTRTSKYLSPVKIGEYLAVGLPVLMSNGVGDEMHYLEENKLGVTIDMENFNSDYTNSRLKKLKELINKYDRGYFRSFAQKYRSYDTVKEVYNQIIEDV